MKVRTVPLRLRCVYAISSKQIPHTPRATLNRFFAFCLFFVFVAFVFRARVKKFCAMSVCLSSARTSLDLCFFSLILFKIYLNSFVDITVAERLYTGFE